jgi:hypothetical protein
MPNSNPKITAIAINAKGGLWTPIAMTIMSGKVTVQEDPAYNNGVAQGLTGYYVDTQPPQPAAVAADWNPVDGVPPGVTLPAYQQTWLPNNNGQEGQAYQPIKFGGSEAGRVHGGYGDYVGAQGTVLLWLTTNSENAGGILLEEWA